MGMLRTAVRTFVERKAFERVIVAVIVVNAITLGLETYPGLMESYGTYLRLIDKVAFGVFFVEFVLKLSAYGRAYWKNSWNIFDFTVLFFTAIPYLGYAGLGNLTVLRAIRILRALRLVTVVPEFRKVVGTLVYSVKGVGAVAGVLVLVLYISSVLASKLFGTIAPETFGSLGPAMLSLFTIMTLEGWREIADPVAAVYPMAYAFFIGFILIGAFVLFNLLITVLMAASERQQEEERKRERATQEELEQKIDELREMLREVLVAREK